MSQLSPTKLLRAAAGRLSLVLLTVGLGPLACSTTSEPESEAVGTGASASGGADAGGDSTGGAAPNSGGADAGGDSSGGAAPNSGGEAAGGQGADAARCTDPQPVLAGHDTGTFRCAEGYLHRAEAKACPALDLTDDEIAWPEFAAVQGQDECARHSDCEAGEVCRAFTQTVATPNYQTEARRVCSVNCGSDADCPESSVCVCGETGGMCEEVSAIAGCTEDADCPSGSLCLENAFMSLTGCPGSASHGFACQLEGDECHTPADCADRHLYECSLQDGGRICQTPYIC